MRAKLFSSLTLTYLILFVMLSLALDFYAGSAVRNASGVRNPDPLVAAIQLKIFILAFCGLVAAAAIHIIFSLRAAGRVEQVIAFSKGLGHGEFQPLALDGPNDELSRLAQALNESAARLDRTLVSLSGERDRSGAILRSMVEGVGVIDAQQRLVFWNRAFAEILNIDSTATEGRPFIEVIRNAQVLQLIRRALRGEESLQDDITTGIVQLRMFAVTAAPVRASDSAGPSVRISGAVVVLHDVTELRRLERVRQDFVANVSHEFKTPLTAIQGFAETLLGGALEDDANNRRFLEIIRDHATQLARVTDDLLKLARIEAGKLEVQFGPVNVADVIELCAETTQLRAGRKGIQFDVHIPADIPHVRGDARLLREVVQNLIDNAVQYTSPGGKIFVEATQDQSSVTISVEDTGIGIPLADQERIFERFYRVDAARSREEGGTGLGLSIARHIVESLGGRLTVESEVGRGSRFFFSVPRSA